MQGAETTPKNSFRETMAAFGLKKEPAMPSRNLESDMRWQPMPTDARGDCSRASDDAPIGMREIVTLADVIAHLPTTLTAKQRDDIVSGIRSFCRNLLRQPETMLANQASVRAATRQLEKRYRGEPKTLRNVLSAVRRGLKLVGVSHWQASGPVTQPWQELLERLSGHGSAGRWVVLALKRFATFASAQSLTPSDVRLQHFEEFAKQQERLSSARDPKRAMTGARAGWNQAVKLLPDLRLAHVHGPSSRSVSLPDEALPASLLADIDDYLANKGLRPDGDGGSTATCSILGDAELALRHAVRDVRGRLHIRKPLSPATLRGQTFMLRASASLLIKAGRPAPDRITDLVLPASVAALIDLQRKRKLADRSIAAQVTALRDIAARWCDLSERDARVLAVLVAQAKQRVPRGMAAGVRERLEAARNPVALRRLLSLPQQLLEGAEGARRAGRLEPKHVLDVQVAVAMRLLLCNPLRRRSLATLDIDHAIVLPRRRGERGTLLVDGAQTKTGDPVVGEFDWHSAQTVRLYLQHYRPLLTKDAENRWLFPGRHGQGRKCDNRIAALISGRIKKATGLDFSVHLFRHLAATLVFAYTDGRRELVQAILGHKFDNDTWEVYTHVAQGWASDKLRAAIARAMEQDAVSQRRIRRGR